MRFGPYQLTDCLGRGGMAAVYKGKRRGVGGFEKQVVVKTILPNLAKQGRFVRMFKEEARLSAQLLHANVVQVLDFGLVGSTPFLELEYLSGMNLQHVWEAAKGPVPVGIALLIATEICRGLAYAHAFIDEAGVHRPIVHRDVSPANVMMCRDGSVKLLDFGLACATRGESVEIDDFRGKLAYMSPEQLERRQVDRRADVFALGALLHELLTGQRLFLGANHPETLHRLRTLTVEMPSKINAEVPPALDFVVLRALVRDPDRRYHSASEMLTGLEALSPRAAHRQELLAWLGKVAPQAFTTPCDGCGRALPSGVECRACKTVADTVIELDPPVPPPQVPQMLPKAPPWMQRQLTIFRLTLSLLWRRMQIWSAERSLRRL
jgi:serine/threonine protein kinase